MALKAMGYARFSDEDLQKKTSIVDQRRAIEAYARDRGLELVGTSFDEGITGATLERPGLQDMMRAVRSGAIKVVIIEDVDRLGRDEEHLQHLKKLFRQFEVKLHTLTFGGEIPDMLFSIKGMFSEAQRGTIAYWTRRGLTGKAAIGGFTGGRVLGYVREVLPSPIGDRVDGYRIDPIGAATVQLIFTLYDQGFSLLRICEVLDRENIPKPHSKTRRADIPTGWNASTLSGNIERGEGILNNEIYIGRIVFNRRKYIEVPNGRGGFDRRPRTNDRSLWSVREMPDLRIIDQAQWDRVKIRQAEARADRDVKFKLTDNPLSGAKRPAHLLSGRVECGVCGEPFIATGAGRWRCRATRDGGCGNGSITASELQSRALTGLREKLLTPELMDRFAVLLQEELRAGQRERGAARVEIERRLADVRASADRLVKSLEGGEGAPKAVLNRLAQLERDEEALTAELDTHIEAAPIRLPTNYRLVYRKAVADLEAALASEEASNARESVRALIERITVLPGDSRGGKTRGLKLEGDLFRMLEFAARASRSGAARNDKLPRHRGNEGVVLPLVAGTGFDLCRTRVPIQAIRTRRAS